MPEPVLHENCPPLPPPTTPHKKTRSPQPRLTASANPPPQPHLPTLDIRDGAIDFLYNVYKRVLPTLGDYLTSPGGHVNLEHVDIILAEVGAIEDEVFRRRKSSEDAEKYVVNPPRRLAPRHLTH